MEEENTKEKFKYMIFNLCQDKQQEINVNGAEPIADSQKKTHSSFQKVFYSSPPPLYHSLSPAACCLLPANAIIIWAGSEPC